MSIKYSSYIKEVLAKIEANKKSALADIGQDMAEKVSKAAPVDTGELRDSVDYEVDETGVTIGAGAEHAIYIELGTSKAPAQPFLETTIKSNIADIESIIDKNMSNK